MSSKAVTDQRQGPFLRKLLSDNVHRQAFEELCNRGMIAEVLVGYLMMIGAAAHHSRKVPAVLEQEDKNLSDELKRLADMIDRTNKGMFAPALHIDKEPYNKIFRLLPHIIRCYASAHRLIRKRANPLRKRRLTGDRLFTIELLKMVESFTGSPNYERMSVLLTKAFTISPDQPLQGGKSAQIPMPKFFETDTLAKLHRSSADLRSAIKFSRSISRAVVTALPEYQNELAAVMDSRIFPGK